MKLKSFFVIENPKVGIFNCPFANQYNTFIEKELKDIGFSKKTDNNNVHAFLTSEFNVNSFLYLNKIKNYILKCVEEYNKTITGGYLKNPIMSNMWGALYCKGDYTESHKHMPYIYSFVYFVRCDKNSSPLKFDKSFFSFDGKSGDLIIFPSHLYHSVPKTSSGRITLVGNIDYNIIAYPS